MELQKALEERRSHYVLGKNTDLTQQEIVDAVSHVVKHAPSAFNNQSTRVAILFGDEKEKFWNHIYDVQKDVLQGEMWDQMSGVIAGARDNALGTVIFFEDNAVADQLPTNEERTLVYKHTADANVQYGTWLSLTELGLGATLQHFNLGYEQGFDKATKEMFGLPDTYEMVAQMPFGSIEAPAGDKEFAPLEDRVHVFGEK